MKQFSKAVALVAVTTLFATAFTTSHLDQVHTPAVSNVAQVVIVGKRMSATEKTQYDNELLAQSDKVRTESVGLAVK